MATEAYHICCEHFTQDCFEADVALVSQFDIKKNSLEFLRIVNNIEVDRSSMAA